MRLSKARNIAFVLVGALFLVACENKSTESETEDDVPRDEQRKVDLFEQARDVHDEVMPYIDSVFSSKGRVQEEIDRITGGLEEVHETRKEALEELQKELDDARQYMMVWMREYGRMPSDTLTEQEVMQRLEESLENIEEVKRKILESLEKADSVLNKGGE